MCQKCEQLSEILLEDQLTVQLMSAQREVGILPASAVRPLFEHEITAQVHFGELEDDLERAILEATGLVEETHAGLLDALLSALFGTKTSLDPLDAITALEKIQQDAPQKVRKILAEAALKLEQLLVDAFAVAASRVVQEFERQGGIPALTLPTLGARAGVLASPAVNRAWSWITQKATEHLAQPVIGLGAPLTKELFGKALEAIKPAGAVDQARQSVHATTGTARIETGAELEPAEIYASELLDGRTCRACAAVDGTEYADLEAAIMDYPSGYYSGCAGGARCRGTLLYIFDL